jgi:hypothetical protein
MIRAAGPGGATRAVLASGRGRINGIPLTDGRENPVDILIVSLQTSAGSDGALVFAHVRSFNAKKGYEDIILPIAKILLTGVSV